MEAKLHLHKISNCGLAIIGEEVLYGQYAKTIVLSNKDFTYTNCIVINLVCRLSSSEEVLSTEYFIVEHQPATINGESYYENDVTTYTFSEDGLYRVKHIILPTDDWLQDYISTFKSSPEDLFGMILVYKDCKIYKYTEGVYTEVTVDNLFELNCTDSESFVESELYTFSVCKLMDCFYNICKNLLNVLCPARCTSETNQQSLIYSRDFLWMSINIIKYLLEKGMYFEAQRILEQIEDCNGFCSNSNSKTGGNNCGCNSRN